MKEKLILCICLAVLTGCSMPYAGDDRKCPPETQIEWIDTVQIDDIQYAVLEPRNYTVEEENLGEVLGEVTYKMADTACADHEIKNGDAAYLDVGTEIYKFNGYKTNFRVIADNKIYEVMENDQARTIGDLYDIEGKVEGMSLRSSYDGRYVMDLKEEHWTEFIDEFLELEYVGLDKIYKEIGNEDRMFFDIHLKDGSSVRILYWPESNAVSPGAFGNKKMLDIISLYN